MLIHNADITGSLTINGTRFNTGSFSGSFTGAVAGTTATASYVEYNSVANKPALVSSSAQIAGYNIFATTGSNQFNGNTTITGSLIVTTGSNVELQVTNTGVILGNISTDVHNVTGSLLVSGSTRLNGNTVVTGSLTVTGQVVAQTLNVQQVTSSIVYSSGSNVFGNSLANTQQLTGSVGVTGSLAVGGVTNIGTRSGGNIRNLNIYGATNANAIIKIDGADGNGYGAQIDFVSKQTNGTSNTWVLGTGINGGTNAFELYNGSSTSLSINLSGSVGIGTVTPTGRFMLYQSSAGNVFQNIVSNQGGSTQVGINLSPSMTDGEVAANPAQASIYATDSNYGANIIFATKTTGAVGNSLTPRMTLDSSGRLGIGATSPSATLDVGSNRTLSGTDPISIYTDVRVASAVTGGLIGYNLRMVALAGSYTVANMYGIKTNTPVVQSGVTVTNSYGIYIGRTDDPTSGGVVTNKYALVTEATAGNVGIGTTLPSAQLNVGHESHGIGMAYMGGSALPAIAGLFTDTSSGQSGYGSLLIKARSDFGGFYSINFFTAASNNTPVERMRITSGGSLQINYNPGGGDLYFRDTTNGAVMFYIIPATYVGTAPFNSNRFLAANSSHISFETGGAERMRITSDNNVLFNTTSTSSTNTSSFIFRSGTGAYSGVMIMNHATTNNTGAGFIDCYYNTSYIGGVAQNGASNVSFLTSSDYRLKEDLKNFNGLNLISNLKVYDFKWKTENSRMYGLIAHELQEVIPYTVSGNKDEMKENGKIKVQVVDYSKLVPVLVKAIQELKSELDTAKAEIQLLKQQ